MAGIVYQNREDNTFELLTEGGGTPERALVTRELGYAMLEKLLVFNSSTGFVRFPSLERLALSDAAGLLGVVAPPGLAGDTLQSVLDSLAGRAYEIVAGVPVGRGFLRPHNYSASSPNLFAVSPISPCAMTAVRLRSADTGYDFTTYLSPSVALGMGAGSSPLETTLGYWRMFVGDDYELRLYDTYDHAASGGSTGWLAQAYGVTPMTPGTWAIRKVSAGSPTTETVGWVVCENGLDADTMSTPKAAVLISRDFSYVRSELVRDFQMELPFCFGVEFKSPDSTTPLVWITVKTRGGATTLSSAATLRRAPGGSGGEFGYVSGRVRITVTANDGTNVTLLTAIAFDDVGSQWVDGSSADKFVAGPVVTVSTVALSDLGANRQFIELAAYANEQTEKLAFVSSSMVTINPLVIS